MNISYVQNLVDTHLIIAYLKEEGTSCNENIMTKLEREKQKELQMHIDNVYPIKEILKDGAIIGYYTKLNPKDRNHSGKISAKTREELETKILAHRFKIKTEDFTMQDIVDKIVADYEINNQKPTGQTHRQNFKRCFDKLSDVKISELTAEMIEAELNTLIKKGIKAKAFDKAVSTLNRINDYCARHNIDCINIRTAISIYRKYELTGKHKFLQDNRLTKNLAFTQSETVDIIIHAMKNRSYKSLFCALALVTGCRAGELLCMSYDNIDLKRHYFHVSEIEDSKTFEIKAYTKENEAREVYLNDNAMMLLNALLELRNQDKHNTNYLFLNSNSSDGKLHLRAADDYLRNLQQELNFDITKELRSLHDGRRTYASIQYLNGVDITLIQRQLGHKKASQTWDYIKDIIDAETRANRLDKGCLLITF